MIHKEKQEKILSKQSVLQEAKAILKSEFIGIDQVIEQVVDNMSFWYLFPELQEKPMIINLWGLTGVGKSSLVNRIVELIGFEKKYYQFNMSKRSNRLDGIDSALEEIYENERDLPIILTFDEFQQARTINTQSEDQAHTVWQILDNGKFQMSLGWRSLDDLLLLFNRLSYLLRKEIRVENGVVVEGIELFEKEMPRHRAWVSDDEAYSLAYFVPKNEISSIHSVVKEAFSTPHEIEEELLKLNGPQTISFLKKLVDLAKSPKTVDCSKALVFIIGNLDKAFSMNSDFNSDISADEFHEQSLKISIPQIKHALQSYFRSEQIARLGNNHIIYPAFSSESFRRIIDLDLKRISKRIFNQQSIQLMFDQSIHELIYKEGVFPTQGTRPVYTTIQQILISKIGRIVTNMYLENITAEKVLLKAGRNQIIADYLYEGSTVHTLFLNHEFSLEKLREDKHDDLQAIVAVHESGHAVLSSILMRTVPEVIYSQTTDGSYSGFVHAKHKWEYISRKEILLRMAVKLGGLEAERLIFGEDHMIFGAQIDVIEATSLATHFLKKSGLYDTPGAFHERHPSTREFLHHDSDELSRRAEEMLLQAKALAQKTLAAQRELLLKMSDYLSDNRQMLKPQIVEMLEKHASNFDINSLIENGDFLYYRQKLKESVNEIEVKLEVAS